MIPVAFLAALAAVTLAILIVAVVAVVRELQRLGGTLVRFQEETRPHLERIEQDARRAAERMERARLPQGGPRAGGTAPAEQASPPPPER